MGGPGSGRRPSGSSKKKSYSESKVAQSFKEGKSFSLNLGKMKTVKMPKNIKKAGIDSVAYRNWIKKNWT